MVSAAGRRNFVRGAGIAAAGAAMLAASQNASAQTPPHDSYNVKSFGAVGDGIANDGTAIQNALNAAGATGGGVVFMPAGRYNLKDSSGGWMNLRVPANVTLQGIFTGPHSWANGTVLNAWHGLFWHPSDHTTDNAALIILDSNSAVRGFSVVYDPDQTWHRPNSVQPITPTIRGGRDGHLLADSITIENIFFLNAWWCIDLATYNCGRHTVRGIFGHPQKLGISVDGSYDVGRIYNVHFWPYWTAAMGDPSSPTVNYSLQNATALELLNCDWEVVHDFFAWGMNRGVVFDKGYAPATNGPRPRYNASGTALDRVTSPPDAQLTQIGFDMTGVGLDVVATKLGKGVTIDTLSLVSALPAHSLRRAIQMDTGASPKCVSISNGTFWGDFSADVVSASGASTSLLITNTRIHDWASGTSAIRVAGNASAAITSCWFQPPGPARTAVDATGSTRATISTNLINGNLLTVPAGPSYSSIGNV